MGIRSIIAIMGRSTAMLLLASALYSCDAVPASTDGTAEGDLLREWGYHDTDDIRRLSALQSDRRLSGSAGSSFSSGLAGLAWASSQTVNGQSGFGPILMSMSSGRNEIINFITAEFLDHCHPNAPPAHPCRNDVDFEQAESMAADFMSAVNSIQVADANTGETCGCNSACPILNFHDKDVLCYMLNGMRAGLRYNCKKYFNRDCVNVASAY